MKIYVMRSGRAKYQSKILLWLPLLMITVISVFSWPACRGFEKSAEELTQEIINAKSSGDRRTVNLKIQKLVKLKGEAAKALISVFEHKDQELQTTAVAAMGQIGLHAVPHLLNALKSNDFSMQRNAVRALELIKNPVAAPHLRRLLNHEDRAFRLQVAKTLVILGDNSGMKFLREASRESDDVEYRVKAVTRFQEIGDARALLPLVDCLKDPDGFVKMEAIKGLENLADKRASVYLNELKENDPSWMIRERAAKAMAKLNQRPEKYRNQKGMELMALP